MRSNVLPARGTVIVAEGVLPDAIAPVELEARVVWLRGAPSDQEFGVEFVRRGGGGVRRLREVVHRLSGG